MRTSGKTSMKTNRLQSIKSAPRSRNAVDDATKTNIFMTMLENPV